jgi:hypothetical protein
VVDNPVVNRLAAVLVIALLSLGMVAAPAPAFPLQRHAVARDHVGATYLDTHGIRLRSTTGKRLSVAVFVDRFSWGSGPTDTAVEVIVQRGHESHNWMFDLDFPNHGHHFRFNLKTGRGELVTDRKTMSGFGRIDLQLTEHGRTSTTSCGGGRGSSVVPVRVKGTFRFATHSHGANSWGSVGSLHKPITFRGHDDITTDYGNPNSSCFLPNPCAAGNGWAAARGLNGGSYVEHGKRHGYLGLFMFKSVGRNHGIQRVDDMNWSTSPPTFTTTPAGPTFTVKTAHLKGGATGSATLTSVKAKKPDTEKCDGGEISEQAWTASYTNGARPLTVTEDIGGAITAKDSPNQGFLYVDTVASGKTPAVATPASAPVSADPNTVRSHVIRLTTLAEWRSRG